MSLYKIGNSLELIKEKTFKFEKEIQQLVEKNLKLLLKLDFIKSEFSLNNFRIDTLAFDEESNSFVIIEFKRDKTFSVVDQGYAYLSLMLNNKADFILEYNENKNKSLKRTDVDWSQSKVIFISPNFTNYQKEAINFKDLPIELWEIKQFENETITFEQVQKANAIESIKTISKNDEKNDVVTKEIKVYTENDHLSKAEQETAELYQKVKEIILNFGDNITFQAKKQTIDFRVNNNIFCDIVIQSKSLKVFLNLKSGELKDELKKSRDVSNVGHWGNGSYEIKVSDTEDIEYISSLIKQSYKKNL
ncbi:MULTISPECIES: DUF5655 domain-containing protein [Empedobacter]|uniref:DUF5655 domain-containing protein n=1 Tax=Empedobacter TaxID=59734 RepID=UPI002578842B|nr:MULTISPECIES: DUF5655 domain-containing protein [Empedobacter]MDM1043216.1 hypothetical protein [Empedobacter brevis]MDM1137143.1 hypothetical protein [Empedobacter sp. R750]